MKNLIDLMREKADDIYIYVGEPPIYVHDETYCKIKPITNELTIDCGYVIGEHVFIYRGPIEEFNEDKLEPGIYIKDEVYVCKEPKGDKMDVYSIDNIVSISLPDIWEDIKNRDAFISEEERELINSNVKEFVPTLKDTDDPLKRLIKLVILEKHVDLNVYKNKFDRKYGLTNLRGTIEGPNQLTMLRFLEWCEMLQLDYTISVFDSGNDRNFPTSKLFKYSTVEGFSEKDLDE